MIETNSYQRAPKYLGIARLSNVPADILRRANPFPTHSMNGEIVGECLSQGPYHFAPSFAFGELVPAVIVPDENNSRAFARSVGIVEQFIVAYLQELRTMSHFADGFNVGPIREARYIEVWRKTTIPLGQRVPYIAGPVDRETPKLLQYLGECRRDRFVGLELGKTKLGPELTGRSDARLLHVNALAFGVSPIHYAHLVALVFKSPLDAVGQVVVNDWKENPQSVVGCANAYGGGMRSILLAPLPFPSPPST